MLLDLINYTAVADKIIIDELLRAEKPLPDAEALFSHVLNAQFIWIRRIKKELTGRDRFDLHPLKDFDGIHVQNIKELLEIYHTHDLATQVIYQNSGGENFVNVAQDILFHIVNHSTYHRAQIASMLKANGISPPVTDYIFLKREGMI
jgi:uncharacterized damage-inducible protein DinB